MRDEQLKYILEQIDICECEEVIENHIYYIIKEIRQRCYRANGSFRYIKEKHEFLIIAEDGEKQGIILRCGYENLHWYVLRNWRNRGVLSNALRTNILQEIWPENRKISCCYHYNDNKEEKYKKTKHLAEIAGLWLEE